MPKNKGNALPKAPRTTYNVIPGAPPRVPDGGDFKSDGSIEWPQFRKMLVDDLAANRAELGVIADAGHAAEFGPIAERIEVLRDRIRSAKKTLRRYGEEVADEPIDGGGG